MRFETRKEASTMAMRKQSAAPAVKSGSDAAASDEQKKQSPSAKAAAEPADSEAGDYLTALGAYGFRNLEPVLLAALVTEDPILLIGKSGTGKTFLLNSISEALGLEHRHYNASLVSFDDLVGFPYPDEGRDSIRFLETPATIWTAESVLVDEISRCKPEHQNRFFSLVHERRVQGIALEKLRYRWAAMNPSSPDQGMGSESYMGSEPLDPALADRFAVVVEVGDWLQLSTQDRQRVADPSGEGARSDDGGRLARAIADWRKEFLVKVKAAPRSILDYACVVTTELGQASIRVSPRRARLLVRTLLAATLVEGGVRSALFMKVLQCSLPHIAWGEAPNEAAVKAAHRQAWMACIANDEERWAHLFRAEPNLGKKVEILVGQCPSGDAGTLAVEELLANESRQRAAAFCLATYPAALEGKLPVGAEAVSDLAKLASELLTIDGQITWHQRRSEPDIPNPELVRTGKALMNLKGPRLARARQLFYWSLINSHTIEDPEAFEAEFNDCFEAVREAIRSEGEKARVAS